MTALCSGRERFPSMPRACAPGLGGAGLAVRPQGQPEHTGLLGARWVDAKPVMAWMLIGI